MSSTSTNGCPICHGKGTVLYVSAEGDVDPDACPCVSSGERCPCGDPPLTRCESCNTPLCPDHAVSGGDLGPTFVCFDGVGCDHPKEAA